MAGGKEERRTVWLVVLVSVFCAFPIWRTTTKAYVALLPEEAVTFWRTLVDNVTINYILAQQQLR